MARKQPENTTQADLHGRRVMVNDSDGDSFEGVCWASDDHGVALIATGKSPVLLHSPDREPLPIPGHCHVPIGQIKFVQVLD